MYHARKLDNFDVHHRLDFECISRSLLIQGEPSFGKTVTLLELAPRLLELTGENDMQLVPRVLSYGIWAGTFFVEPGKKESAICLRQLYR
jgi:hypothetical protein